MRILLFLSSFIITAAAAVALYLSVFGTQFTADYLRALAGSGTAAYRVGHAFEHGFGAQKDPVRARAWYTTAANRDVSDAAIELALMHAQGVGGPQDHAAAMALFRQAAGQGDARAQMSVARAAFLGAGMEKDEKEGAQWVMKAADAGSSAAMGLLGTLYLGGIGVEQDFEKAMLWLGRSEDSDARDLSTRLRMMSQAINDLPPESRREQWQKIYAEAETDIRATFDDIIAKDPYASGTP